jgi:hypothetical protein
MKPRTKRNPDRIVALVFLKKESYPSPKKGLAPVFRNRTCQVFPVPAICETREYALVRCLYPGWHCNGRIYRVVLPAAAQEDLHYLVDDEQGNG